MRELLDPWTDAAFIANKLDSARSRLIAIIGAEAWCEKCRSLKPHVETLAQQAADRDIVLWFDLEEHQEFLGTYIPESLPEVLVYQRGQLVSRSLLPDGTENSLLIALQRMPPNETGHEDPGIAQRLMQQDWA
jgi:thioredoxin-like negative regulator of GroEL